MSRPTLDTEYFVLSPRGQHGVTPGKVADTKQCQRGRSADRGGGVGQGSHSDRPTNARERAVAEVMEAQHKDRERLCVFKSAGEASSCKALPEEESVTKGSVGHHSTCSACGQMPLGEDGMTPSKWPESLRQEEDTPHGTPSGRERSNSVRGHRARLTQPVAPRLRTSERSASRSLSVGSRSCSEPPREFHSFAEMVTSFNERGVRYKRSGHCGTPERSVNSTFSARSARSVSSSRGRVHSTSTLTFPRGPELSTESRAEMRRDHCSRSVSRGTPERSVRSMYSAPSVHQSDVPLTVPCGPVLATAKRARSRSVHSRTPSISRSDRPTLTGEVGRSLPSVKLEGCHDKKVTHLCGERRDTTNRTTPADENAKPADENSNPTGEIAKSAGEQAKTSHTKPVENEVTSQADASKELTDKENELKKLVETYKDAVSRGDDQKPQARGPLSQLNITDYLPGDEAKGQLPARAELVRLQTLSQLEQKQAGDKERLFRFCRKKGAQSGAGETDAPVAEAA